MEFNWDELNIGNFRFDEFHSEPSEFLSSELHSPKRRADGKGYDFGLDDEIRTDLDYLDEEVVLKKITEYFEPMGISQTQKSERVKKAKECFDDFLFMLYWIDRLRENGSVIPWEKVLSDTHSRIMSVFSADMDNDIKLIIGSDVSDFVDATNRHLGEPYYLSPERALNLSLAVTSDVENNLDYARDSKGKKSKTWHTMADGRERETHRILNGKTIPVSSLFRVGESIMAYPRDMTYDPDVSETANCRCWLTYR